MFLQSNFILGNLVALLLFFPIFFAQAYFRKEQPLPGNKMIFGDWEGPRILITECPPESLVSGEIRLKLRSTDNFSPIQGFEYTLFSHDLNDPHSDWVREEKSLSCSDGFCDDLEEELELKILLGKIANPHHLLCPSNEEWCQEKIMPPGNYFLQIRAFDNSKTLGEEGNKGEAIIFRFEKKDSVIICNLPTIYARSGERIEFPDISCEGESELSEIKWDLDERDGLDFSGADLTGNSPLLEKGVLIPGTYRGTVKAQNFAGEEKTSSFILDIANPELKRGDLVINEFIPNPSGEDDSLLPEGEWLEIYNQLGAGVDLLGFVFYDEYNDHDLVIKKENVAEGDTIIPPVSYKIIYRNGDPKFSLNNSGPEKVRLYEDFLENNPLLLDEGEYTSGINEGKVFARIPNISGELKITLPTKGLPNLEEN